MTKLFTSLTAVAAIAVTVTTANAGTEQTSSKEMAAAPAPEVYNWTGFYIGGNAGANFNEFDFGPSDARINALTIEGFLLAAPFTFRTNGDNGRDEMEFIGGGQGGYNFQFGRWLVGLEADFQGVGDVDREYSDSAMNFQRMFFRGGFGGFGNGESGLFVDTFTHVKINGRADTDWFASVRPRFGYTFGPVLLYVTGGVAFNNTTVTSQTSVRTRSLVFGEFLVDQSSSTSRSSDENLMVGWTVGGGLEYQINRWLTAGVEYRHSEFGDENFSFDGGGRVGPRSMDVNLVNDQVTAKVNVLFMNLFGGH